MARRASRERGQALTEVVVVAGFVLVPLLILGVYVGKWGYLQDRSIEAARYAAWERVVSPAAPPAGRDWASLKSDADLQKEVSIRFFGGRNERLTAVTGSAGAAGLAAGSSREPLLRKHDWQPLLVQREQNITVATRQEAFDGGWTEGVMNAFGKLVTAGARIPLQMTGPTVAAVTVSAAGLPQRIFAEVGLADPLQFKAQAAVLTDPWTANGPGEEERLLREGIMKRQETLSKTKVGFSIAGQLFYLATWPLGKLAEEFEKHWNDPDRDRLKIDTEQQFGDRLQPYPQIPPYPGP
ncbi:hypothetical protein HFU84_08820 [Acidithiobacillus sp. CV18-2]|uniref:Uncharacterized protein n=1 Tax=Igneacidithiobacillus copahuensis TaxID=2724909 RepID=A0AAE2YS50_9PROT|nr:hypothetical protein [Acidithiobacillus sp. CV18-3]MBU2758507.1 hypothetical protein [Acidithiobacillus sp. BN09-2]MBU2777604.1 hypothetical protein [Acidithiobacillus sp. CV18-2]MBU2789235.1 hypothetical protein [Igneacidithiobacillus copahuensis]MBU2797698.1 hypothetical protein [Acidithiobacillus sp. VAN18-2]MBU2798280.1 hypothetical protein [Acidithiobacillus sp. VAN18-4]